MFGLRLTIDAHARSKNGQPAQKTTGVAKTRPIQLTSGPRAIVTGRRRPCRPSSATKTGSAKRGRDPEAPRHVDELGIRPVVERDGTRLERHAADRTRARRVADDLRMHRTGEAGSWRRRGRAADASALGNIAGFALESLEAASAQK